MMRPRNLALHCIILGSFLFIALTGTKAAPVIQEPHIILVPGLVASVNFKDFYGIGSDEWQWTPTAETWYEGLIARLEDAGLTVDVVWYDWRDGIEDSARWLDERIQFFKDIRGTSEVSLIGHSMGGMVARMYVESDYYDGDVENLITLGSPHFGAAQAYFAWEGGEAYGWEAVHQAILEATIRLWQVRGLEKDKMAVVHEKVPGLQDLLPIYPYLFWANTGEPLQAWQGDISDWAINETLLNSNFFLDQHFNPVDVEKIVLVQGKGVTTPAIDTMCVVYVNPDPNPNDLKWIDGEPDRAKTGQPKNGLVEEGEQCVEQTLFFDGTGDGTVPSYDGPDILGLGMSFFEAIASAVGATYQTFDVAHGAMPNDPQVQAYIFEQLGIPLPDGAYTPPTIPTDVMLFYAASPVTLRVTDPNGNFVGPDGASIDGAEYLSSGGADPITIITIPNPLAGDYQVNLTGMGKGEYHLGTAYFSDDVSTDWTEVQGKMRKGREKTYQVTLSPSTDGEDADPETPILGELKKAKPKRPKRPERPKRPDRPQRPDRPELPDKPERPKP